MAEETGASAIEAFISDCSVLRLPTADGKEFLDLERVRRTLSRLLGTQGLEAYVDRVKYKNNNEHDHPEWLEMLYLTDLQFCRAHMTRGSVKLWTVPRSQFGGVYLDLVMDVGDIEAPATPSELRVTLPAELSGEDKEGEGEWVWSSEKTDREHARKIALPWVLAQAT